MQLAEETKNPTRNVPLALVLAISTTTVLYVAVAIAAVSVLGWETLGASKSPLADVVDARVGWSASAAMSIIALFSTANTVLILMMSASRILYGMAEDGALPEQLAWVHPTRQSPWAATVAIALAAAFITVLFREIGTVANLTNFALFVTFVFINLSVIALRFREPDVPRPFRVPLSVAGVPLVPLAGAGSALLMIGGVGWKVVVAGLLLLAVGTGVQLLRGR